MTQAFGAGKALLIFLYLNVLSDIYSYQESPVMCTVGRRNFDEWTLEIS
jgi:hypothetical protein